MKKKDYENMYKCNQAAAPDPGISSCIEANTTAQMDTLINTIAKVLPFLWHKTLLPFSKL